MKNKIMLKVLIVALAFGGAYADAMSLRNIKLRLANTSFTKLKLRSLPIRRFHQSVCREATLFELLTNNSKARPGLNILGGTAVGAGFACIGTGIGFMAEKALGDKVIEKNDVTVLGTYTGGFLGLPASFICAGPAGLAAYVVAFRFCDLFVIPVLK